MRAGSAFSDLSSVPSHVIDGKTGHQAMRILMPLCEATREIRQSQEAMFRWQRDCGRGIPSPRF